MNVPRRRGLGRVGVAVSVEPDQSERLVLAREMAVDPAIEPIAMLWSPPSTSGIRPFSRLRCHLLPQLVADREDRRLVAKLSLADLLGLGDHHVEVPESWTLWPSCSRCELQIRDADRRGAHVDAAPAGAEIDGHADHLDVALPHGHEGGSLAAASNPANFARSRGS